MLLNKLVSLLSHQISHLRYVISKRAIILSVLTVGKKQRNQLLLKVAWKLLPKIKATLLGNI